MDSQQLKRESSNELSRHFNRNVSDTECAYLAGFFDGEGCVSIDRTNFALTISASNTDSKPIVRLLEVFAGHVRADQRASRNKQLYLWTVHSYHASAVANEFLPYSCVKLDQLLLAIEFQAVRASLNPEQKHDYYLQMRGLKNECAN